jgi:uncharacterized protein (TIGR02996 family)
MTDREALLRAVCESPDDDLPRLVFADWLEEHDEPERAEFIRVQVELNRQHVVSLETVRLHDRMLALLDAHLQDWLDELPQLPGVQWSDVWSRGFPEEVTIDSLRDFATHQEAILHSAPVQKVTVWDAIGFGRFAETPLVRGIQTLAFCRPRFTNGMAKQLLHNPNIGPITCIDLRGQLLTTEMALLLKARLRERVLV